MTEKRFTVVYDDIIDLGSVYDSETERFILVGTLTRTELICNLLNELNDEVVKGDLFKLTVAMAIQHRINWLKKQIWDNSDRIDELQSLKKELQE